jgi:hypothetical protein
MDYLFFIIKKIMDSIAGMVVNWLTARRTLGAVNSIRKYYPDMKIYIVDDGSDEKDKGEFMSVYKDEAMQAGVIYDPDNAKLQGIPNTEFIGLNHHMRHGESIDYANSVIKNEKWILGLDSDARLIKEGVIKYMTGHIDDMTCQIGVGKTQNSAYPHVAFYCNMYRRDLAYEYAASFKPMYGLSLEAGTRYSKTLADYGYSVKAIGLRDYFIHLRWDPNKDTLWKKYY